jgi:3-hydroxyisobutyrate dehydrogenase-like beta-hydroxyacid dehydrogenase
VTPSVANGAVSARLKAVSAVKTRPVAKSPTRNGRVGRGTRFKVEFEVQTVLRAADVREALRQVRALGAIEVLAITQEN